MPVLPNPQHEKFALEVARGQPQGKAYVLAGYKENESHASRLVNKGNIRARIEEIKTELVSRLVDRAIIDREWVVAELVDTYNDARKKDRHGAAVRCLELAGKEIGMFGDNVNVNVKASEAFLAALDRLALQTKKPIMIEGEKVE